MAEVRQSQAIAALKSGWSEELKRLKGAWSAGEKAKREQWVSAKTNEIKELTVKVRLISPRCVFLHLINSTTLTSCCATAGSGGRGSEVAAEAPC